MTDRPVLAEPDLSVRARSRYPKLVLAGIILIFIVLTTLIAIKTPPFESDDEPDHVQNIETLVGGHWYAIPSTCRLNNRVPLATNCAGDEPQQAPLYYLLFAAGQLVVGIPAHAPYRGALNPAFFFFGSPQLFVHQTTAVPDYLLWLRLFNVALGVLTVLVTYFAVQLITGDQWTPVIAASLVAFLPRMVFLSSFVTNDNLVNLLGAVLTFFVLKFSKSPSARRMVAIGLLLGVLLITKLSTLPLVLVLVPLSFFVRGWRFRAKLFCAGIVSTIAVSGWYLIQNTVRYGDPLARRASAVYLAKIGGLGTLHGHPYEIGNPLRLVFAHVPKLLLDSFWYESGWNTFRWSLPVNVLFFTAAAIALLGLLHGDVKGPVMISLTSICVAALASVWVVALQAGSSARYALVGLPALATLAALGVEHWKVPFRFLFPALGLGGTLVATQLDVLGFHWT